jgi:hypothetical protein
LPSLPFISFASLPFPCPYPCRDLRSLWHCFA